MIKYPIGIQSFEKLRQDNLVYVDKTEYIVRLIQSGSYYFLSRPRRFGKSLLLSTLKAYFEGKRELFKGLYIDTYKHIDWESHPVIYIDFNGEKYIDGAKALFARLNTQLRNYEKIYGLQESSDRLAVRFMNILTTAYQKTGKKIVILIDEYEKPILDTLHKPEIMENHRNTLSGFYSVLKSCDSYIRFCFLTGVTQFGQLSIFSGLNNLQDISLNKHYAAICGITEQEVKDNFKEGIENIADSMDVSFDEAAALLKQNYDGYHFSQVSPDVYNPFSLLNAFSEGELRAYWFKTATPTFLVDIFKKGKVNLVEVDGAKVTEEKLYGVPVELKDIFPLLYQSGYLTIKDYDKEFQLYTLGYPNREVKKGFLTALLPLYTADSEEVSGNN